MFEMTSEQVWIVVALIALTVIAIFAYIVTHRARLRRAGLKQRFGREYDRAVEEYGDVDKAERELLHREKRVQHLKLHALREPTRQQYAADWSAVQARFVDDPSGAVKTANDLIDSVMRARGYPVEDFERRVADLSVEHGNVVQHYRAARVLADANREGRANTEELRQAFVHYRALFSDLLAEPDAPGGAMRGAHV
jgi:hypothetical protein